MLQTGSWAGGAALSSTPASGLPAGSDVGSELQAVRRQLGRASEGIKRVRVIDPTA
jgi:hypothetical protein